MRDENEIKIIGARENNLKNISVNIPKGKFVVLTGVSGSGKSSIAFNTLQKECQRRYMDSLGMVNEHIGKPLVDRVIGLSPSISVSQYSYNGSPRSTVGTLTELYSYLRLIYSKLGERKCIHCDHSIASNLQMNILDNDFEEDESEEFEVTDESKDEFQDEFRCPSCNQLIEPLTMSSFSFNTVEGICSCCKGLGYISQINPSKVIHEELSIAEGAVEVWGKGEIELYGGALMNASSYYGFPFEISTPVKDLHPAAHEILFYGVYSPQITQMYPEITPPSNINMGRFIGALNVLGNRLKEHADEDRYKEQVHKYMIRDVCPECKGAKLKPQSLKVTINGVNIFEVSNMSLLKLKSWIETLRDSLSNEIQEAIKGILDEFADKVDNFIQAGVSYLCLSRPSSTLSTGEVQRIRLASLLGSELTGVVYVLDEPTAGLHQKDTRNLISLMKKLCDGRNTVLVIEHDMDVMRAADYIIDIGPGAGKNGGQLVYAGDYEGILKCRESITGKCLNGEKKISSSKAYRKGNGKSICIRGAREHNLKNVNVDFPLGKLVAVTGVTGAGKSSLVFDVLDKSARVYFNNDWNQPGLCDEVKGLDQVNSVIAINQASIGRMSRSNVATYTDVFTSIRNHFANLEDAKNRGIPSKYFSCNTQGGRCEKCQGMGRLSINMQYLPPTEVICPVCKGKRFKSKILSIKYKGYSISDVLNMTVEEALCVFEDVKSIHERLKLLSDVGLDYLILGQSATTLSGGEAQRIKISRELLRKKNNNILYLLDEPTGGLHPNDIIKLMSIIQRLVDNGNSVIMIEHNIDVIRACDYVIDLGPEGGEFGGKIIAEGIPDEIMKQESSITGQALRSL